MSLKYEPAPEPLHISVKWLNPTPWADGDADRDRVHFDPLQLPSPRVTPDPPIVIGIHCGQHPL